MYAHTTADGKQYDTLKKSTMNKTLENTFKVGMNTYCRLVMTKESLPMMKTHTGNAGNLRWVGGWSETGCRGGGCHMD